MDKTTIMRMTVELVQEGNTLGTTDETEILNIDLEYQLPGDAPFMVIKTEGWSFNDVEELAKLIKNIKEAESHIRKGLE